MCAVGIMARQVRAQVQAAQAGAGRDRPRCEAAAVEGRDDIEGVTLGAALQDPIGESEEETSSNVTTQAVCARTS
jgi:hypothetical protein